MNARTVLPVIIAILALSSRSAAQPIDVVHYKADITFDLAAPRLDGIAELRITNAPQNFVLHLRDLVATTVDINAVAATFSQADGELRINAATAPSPSDTIVARIAYGGKATSEAGSPSWGGCFWGPVSFMMGVGFYAPYVSMMRHWIPSNDIPSDKATFDLTYIVPDGYSAAGTGLLTEVRSAGGSTAYRWVETHQTATYLATYAIGRYARITGDWNGLPLEYYVLKADSLKGVAHFASVPGMLDAFTHAYGPYPFDKVGYCMTPIGSMEHQTMISYASTLLTAQPASRIAAHELAHQWWGDCVTATTFADAWLSEGFATFSEAIYAEHTGGRSAYEAAGVQFANSYLNQVAPSEGVFPLHDFPRAAPSSNYPSTIYEKGAAVLRMLRHIMGDSAFFRGLRAYRAAHAYGNATTDDFRAAMEGEHGQTLDWFFDEWVMKPGWPVYTVQKIVELPSTGPFRLRILQGQDSTKVPFFRMPIDLRIIRSSGDTTLVTIENRAQRAEDFVFPAIPANTVVSYLIDPKNVILKTASYRTVGVDSPPPDASHGAFIASTYPNPMRSDKQGNAILSITSATPMRLRLSIFDSLGREVRLLAEREWHAGRHSVPFSIAGLPSGTYTLRLRSHAGVSLQRLVVQH
jgi:aminopeptidase N